jgi:hypothetical protein
MDSIMIFYLFILDPSIDGRKRSHYPADVRRS